MEVQSTHAPLTPKQAAFTAEIVTHHHQATSFRSQAEAQEKAARQKTVEMALLLGFTPQTRIVHKVDGREAYVSSVDREKGAVYARYYLSGGVNGSKTIALHELTLSPDGETWSIELTNWITQK